jgi:hypothetical protein
MKVSVVLIFIAGNLIFIIQTMKFVFRLIKYVCMLFSSQLFLVKELDP